MHVLLNCVTLHPETKFQYTDSMVYIKIHRESPNNRSTESRRQAKELGSVGETLASQWLSERGYTIIENNYRPRKHEIDIVAIEGGDLVIIEVKTRNSNSLCNPEDSVDHRKRQFLVRLADQYVRSHNWQGNTRFDIVSIVMQNGKPEINLIKDAFNAMNF